MLDDTAFPTCHGDVFWLGERPRGSLCLLLALAPQVSGQVSGRVVVVIVPGVVRAMTVIIGNRIAMLTTTPDPHILVSTFLCGSHGETKLVPFRLARFAIPDEDTHQVCCRWLRPDFQEDPGRR